jgi:hypothetical protein
VPARKATRARKPELKPVKFVAVERAFKPQVKVRATRDMSGWVDRGEKTGRRVKFHIGKGRIGLMDAEHAREFAAKGYVEILEGGEQIKPVSEDEAAEILSTVTTISLGEPNG